MIMILVREWEFRPERQIQTVQTATQSTAIMAVSFLPVVVTVVDPGATQTREPIAAMVARHRPLQMVKKVELRDYCSSALGAQPADLTHADIAVATTAEDDNDNETDNRSGYSQVYVCTHHSSERQQAASATDDGKAKHMAFRVAQRPLPSTSGPNDYWTLQRQRSPHQGGTSSSSPKVRGLNLK
jgi:hypothetical protein